jgi:hypothetical protein
MIVPALLTEPELMPLLVVKANMPPLITRVAPAAVVSPYTVSFTELVTV